MNRNLIPFCLLAILLCIFSCQREFDGLPQPVIPTPELPDTPGTDPTLPPVVPADNQVLTSIQGKVSDENGDPMQNAIVSAGNKTSFTNEHGIFRITDILVPEHSTYIRADKSGYFTGSRTIVSRQGGTGFVRIKMMPKQLKSTFNAEDGATVNISDISTVELPPDAITTTAGHEYQGRVRVYGAVINPEVQDFNETMPGNLIAINADSQFTALKSYGMLTVNLETESGEPLQLAAGKAARIKMKIPPTMVSSAPAEIPLWHFGETDGIWREEGKAILQNGWYEGSVSHFSTWNYDVPSAFVFVTLDVRGMKGGARPYSRVKIIDTRNGTYTDLYSDSAGYVKTWVPKDAPLEVQVLTECGALLYSKVAPPMSQDGDLGIVYVGFTQTINVKGTVQDCDNQPVTSGYAYMFFRGLNYTTEIIDGEFNFYMSKCESGNNAAELYVINGGTHYQTHVNSFNISGQNQDLGVIKNCDLQWKEYVYYKIGSDSILAELDRAIMTYSGFVNGDTLTRIHFIHRLYDVGSFEITVQFRDSSVHTSTINNPSPVNLYNEDYTPVAPLIVDVKKYGAVGEEVFLTFSGTYKKNSSGEIVPLIGEMRVIRTE